MKESELVIKMANGNNVPVESKDSGTHQEPAFIHKEEGPIHREPGGSLSVPIKKSNFVYNENMEAHFGDPYRYGNRTFTNQRALQSRGLG